MSIFLSSKYSPLSVEQISHMCPSIYSDTSCRNENTYNFIPTKTLLERMTEAGFFPTSVYQTKKRDTGKLVYAKHMIMFRHQSTFAEQANKELVPQVILVNAHDGTSPYKIFCGLFRFVCSNSLIVGDMLGKALIHHRGYKNTLDNVIDASFKVLDQSNKVLKVVDEWSNVQLEYPQKLEIAQTAHVLKFGIEETPIKPEQFLIPRNADDYKNEDTLWNTFNIVQENLFKGGISAWKTTKTGGTRKVSTRPINNIHENVDMNIALWNKAEAVYNLVA